MLEYLLSNSKSFLAATGLTLDLVGVVLLGLDLIRVQRNISKEAAEAVSRLETFLIDYGHLPEALSDLQRQTRRIHLSEYWDHHAEDEASYNVDRLIERSKELSGVVEEVALWTQLLVEFQNDQSNHEKRLVRLSIRFSVVGLALIVIGFAVQILAQFL